MHADPELVFHRAVSRSGLRSPGCELHPAMAELSERARSCFNVIFLSSLLLTATSVPLLLQLFRKHL